MARPSDLQVIVQSFVSRLVAVVDAATTQRIQSALAQAIGSPLKRGPGRPPKRTLSPVIPAKASKGPLTEEPPLVPKRKPHISAKQARARKVQGQYLVTMRTLSAEARTRVGVVAKEEGVSEALKLARSLKK